MLLENATHPHIAGGKEGRSAEPLAAQVRRRRYAPLRIDEDEAVPETPMQEHRQREPWVVAIMRGEIGGGVELAQVEFLAVAHAMMAFARAHAGEHDEIDPVRLDRAVGERADEVVATGREGELQAHGVIQMLRADVAGSCCGRVLARNAEKELVTSMI